MMMLACSITDRDILKLYFILLCVLPSLLASPLLVAETSAWLFGKTLRRRWLEGRPLSLFAAVAFVPIEMYFTIGYFLAKAEVYDADLRALIVLIFSLIWSGPLLALLGLRKFEPVVDAGSVKKGGGRIWLQDLVIAMTAIGVWLLLVQQLPTLHDDKTLSMAMYALYLIVVSVGGLRLAASLSGSSAFGQQPLVRGVLFLFVLLTMPFMFPGLVFSWWIWRTTRKRAALAKPVKPAPCNLPSSL